MRKSNARGDTHIACFACSPFSAVFSSYRPSLVLTWVGWGVGGSFFVLIFFLVELTGPEGDFA